MEFLFELAMSDIFKLLQIIIRNNVFLQISAYKHLSNKMDRKFEARKL